MLHQPFCAGKLFANGGRIVPRRRWSAPEAEAEEGRQGKAQGQ
jgi:hypothetical protein